jgi:hypothetical protein
VRPAYSAVVNGGNWRRHKPPRPCLWGCHSAPLSVLRGVAVPAVPGVALLVRLGRLGLVGRLSRPSGGFEAAVQAGRVEFGGTATPS